MNEELKLICLHQIKCDSYTGPFFEYRIDIQSVTTLQNVSVKAVCNYLQTSSSCHL